MRKGLRSASRELSIWFSGFAGYQCSAMVIEKISAYVFYRMLWRNDTSLLNENRAGVCFFLSGAPES